MLKLKEKLMEHVFFVAALTSIFFVGLICLFMFANGLPAFIKIGPLNFVLGREWSPGDVPPLFGIFPMIVGSLYITGFAILLGVPIGIFSAMFLAAMCPKPLYRLLKPAVELMAGIPSVVYGFFGMVTLVPLVRRVFGGNGNSILTASMLLGFMILPTIINITESGIRAVPKEMYNGALALGASHERAMFSVVLLAARASVLAAVALGVGRAIGETMAVIMVAGNQARMPAGLLKGARTLTANIVIEMGYAAELHREALIATGVVLFFFILCINILIAVLGKEGVS